MRERERKKEAGLPFSVTSNDGTSLSIQMSSLYGHLRQLHSLSVSLFSVSVRVSFVLPIPIFQSSPPLVATIV